MEREPLLQRLLGRITIGTASHTPDEVDEVRRQLMLALAGLAASTVMPVTPALAQSEWTPREIVYHNELTEPFPLGVKIKGESPDTWLNSIMISDGNGEEVSLFWAMGRIRENLVDLVGADKAHWMLPRTIQSDGRPYRNRLGIDSEPHSIQYADASLSTLDMVRRQIGVSASRDRLTIDKEEIRFAWANIQHLAALYAGTLTDESKLVTPKVPGYYAPYTGEFEPNFKTADEATFWQSVGLETPFDRADFIMGLCLTEDGRGLEMVQNAMGGTMYGDESDKDRQRLRDLIHQISSTLQQ